MTTTAPPVATTDAGTVGAVAMSPVVPEHTVPDNNDLPEGTFMAFCQLLSRSELWVKVKDMLPRADTAIPCYVGRESIKKYDVQKRDFDAMARIIAKWKFGDTYDCKVCYSHTTGGNGRKVRRVNVIEIVGRSESVFARTFCNVDHLTQEDLVVGQHFLIESLRLDVFDVGAPILRASNGVDAWDIARVVCETTSDTRLRSNSVVECKNVVARVEETMSVITLLLFTGRCVKDVRPMHVEDAASASASQNTTTLTQNVVESRQAARASRLATALVPSIILRREAEGLLLTQGKLFALDNSVVTTGQRSVAMRKVEFRMKCSRDQQGLCGAVVHMDVGFFDQPRDELSKCIAQLNQPPLIEPAADLYDSLLRATTFLRIICPACNPNVIRYGTLINSAGKMGFEPRRGFCSNDDHFQIDHLPEAERPTKGNFALMLVDMNERQVFPLGVVTIDDMCVLRLMMDGEV
jgi:hypothetical protein